jgi:hypothetical protein
MAISSPCKALAKTHIATFVNCPVAREAFAKMRMKALLVTTYAAATKRHGMQDSSRILCHEEEFGTAHASVHGRERRFAVARL